MNKTTLNLLGKYFEKKYFGSYHLNKLYETYLVHVSSVRFSGFGKLSRATFLPSTLVTCASHFIGELLGLDMEYLREKLVTIAFNKNQSSTETEAFIDLTFNRIQDTVDGPCFYTVYIPQSNEGISTKAKSVMYNYTLEKLGLTVADKIDSTLEEYFKPVDCTLWSIYYKPEVGTVIMTDYEREQYDTTGRKYLRDLVQKVYIGQFLFRTPGCLNPVYADVIENTLLDIARYVGDYYEVLGDHGILFKPANELLRNESVDLVIEKIRKYQDLLEIVTADKTDLLKELQLDCIKEDLQKYISIATQEFEQDVITQGERYRVALDDLNRVHARYLDAQTTLQNFKSANENFVANLVTDINAVTSSLGEDISVELLGTRTEDRNCILQFRIKGPVQGIDLDDLDMTPNIHSSREYVNETKTLLDGSTDYELWFDTEVDFNLNTFHPHVGDNTYRHPERSGILPNTHLAYFNCWGNTPGTLHQLRNTNDLKTALAIFIRAALSLNVRDNTVYSKLLTRMYDKYGSQDQIIRNKVTKEFVTFVDFCNSLIRREDTDTTDNEEIMEGELENEDQLN